MSYLPPGSIELKSIVLQNFDGSEKHDIRGLVLEFNLYSSITVDHIRADVVVSEALALLTRMPLVGEETLSVTFVTPSNTPDSYTNEPVTAAFRVIRLDNLTFQDTRNAVYRLVCVSPTHLADMMRVVQDPFGPGLISDFVKKVGKDYLGIPDDKFEVEATSGQQKFVIPSWSPTQTMKFFCREAFSAQYKPSNFAFWQDWNKWHFESLDGLMTKPIKPRSHYYLTEHSLGISRGQQTSSGPISGSLGRAGTDNAAEEFRYIMQLKFNTLFDIESAIGKGLWDSTVLWIDPLLQQYEAIKHGADAHFSYRKQFKDFKHLANDPHELCTENAQHGKPSGQSHIRYMYANPKQTLEKHQMAPRQRQDKLSHFLSSVEQLEAISLNMVVPGDTNRLPGDIIQIDLPEFGATDDIVNELYQYLSKSDGGKWMVAAVRHKYTYNANFVTILNVVKNAYEHKIQRAPLTATGPEQVANILTPTGTPANGLT